MRLVHVVLLIAGLSLTSVSLAGSKKNNIDFLKDYFLHHSALQKFGIGHRELLSVNGQSIVRKYYLDGDLGAEDGSFLDPISNYETYFPRGSQPKIDKFEKYVLTAYLDNPKDKEIAKLLAIYHVAKAVSSAGGRLDSSGALNKGINGAVIQHLVISQYFLHRAEDLGSKDKWLKKALQHTGKLLEKHGNQYDEISTDESSSAQSYFIQAFNYQEENRFNALHKLLNDYALRPGNLATIFQITSGNLWVGGEADYDDPTVLYNFVIGSWFSIKSIIMAEELQELAEADPDNYQPLRVANILGGMSILQRRWLAKLHDDAAAVSALDDEHRQWLDLYPAFHSFTVGIAFFEEEENFLEGAAAWDLAFTVCQVRNFRTCQNRPRFSFNIPGIMLGQVDFLLKSGQLDLASQYLTWAQYNPHYPYWDLGQAAVEHRQANLQEIYDRYQNDDPNDDPTHFLMKKRKWSSSTSTCQVCHQAQSKSWSDEEKASIIIPQDDVLYFDWPAISTAWYGENL